MYIRNDLSPRYPSPRPLLFFEEWAALVARLQTVADSLKDSHLQSRLYTHCQRYYDALLASAHPAYPAPSALPALFPKLTILHPVLPKTDTEIFEFTTTGTEDPFGVSETAIHFSEEALQRYAATHPLPTIATAGAYLTHLYAYAYRNALLDRLYLLDLMQPHHQHPFDLANLDLHFAFLAVYFRTKGKSPALALQ